jgi:hypothetical protein
LKNFTFQLNLINSLILKYYYSLRWIDNITYTISLRIFD